jgi:hypothetical protein
MPVEKSGGILVKSLIGFLIVLLALSIFKNISYPLVWNDEAETAMFAKRILTFGYPKVHDGTNVLNLLELPDKNLAIDKERDAYVVTVWGHFYFAVIGELLSRLTDDIYLKTALLRIPFAIAGFIGLLVFALTGLQFFRHRNRGLYFLAAFFFLEFLSIPLMLHMREVRYYSLAMLLLSIIFYLYSRYAVFKTLRLSFYIPFLTIFMLLLYNAFPPPFFACAATIGLIELYRFTKRWSVRELIQSTLPLIIAVLLVLPLLRFLHTAEISKAYALFFHISGFIQKDLLLSIVSFLWQYEFLCVILFARISALSLQRFIKPHLMNPGKGRLNRTVMSDSVQEERKEIMCRMNASHCLSILIVLYILLASKIPLPVIYERYFIFLQPFLSIILLFDIFNIASLLSQVQSVPVRKCLSVVPVIMAGLFVVYGFNKIELLNHHIYELFHQYKGPLDYAIPYIQSNYKDTENLTIATNYEECSLMYYLGSKVIIGYVGNNLEEDMTMTPDIIIFRKKWTYTSKAEIFAPFFAKARYKPVTFEVFDNTVNNIPQISGPIRHLFKTKMARTEKEALVLHIKY